jgi:hypothetical protein
MRVRLMNRAFLWWAVRPHTPTCDDATAQKDAPAVVQGEYLHADNNFQSIYPHETAKLNSVFSVGIMNQTRTSGKVLTPDRLSLR